MTEEQLKEALLTANHIRESQAKTITRLRKACYKYIGERNDAIEKGNAVCERYREENKELKGRLAIASTVRAVDTGLRDVALSLSFGAVQDARETIDVLSEENEKLSERVQYLEMLARADEKVKSALRESRTQCVNEVRLFKRENELLRAERSTWNAIKNITLIALGGATFAAIVKLLTILA